MHPGLIILGVGTVFVLGAALYLAFREEERPMENRSSRRSSSRRRSMTLVEYPPNPQNISGTNSEVRNRSSRRQNHPDLANSRTLNRPLPSHRNSTHSSSNSFPKCLVCESAANAKFLPCGHSKFCYEHANYYLELKDNDEFGTPKCPQANCHKVIERIVE